MRPPSLREFEGVLIIRYDDPTVLNDVPSLWTREEIYREVKLRRSPLVVVDLEPITFVSSLGIGTLVGLKRRVEAEGGKIVLINVQPYVRDILHSTNLDKILPITTDLPSAIALLAANSPS